MLKSRIRRRTIEGARASARLVDVEASIAALKDEDLLDLADIFAGQKASPMFAMAAAEMARRNLSL